MGIRAKNPLSGEKGGVSDFFETFDSGGGPTIPESEQDNFANRDSDGGLKTMNGVDDTQGNVPEVSSTKR